MSLRDWKGSPNWGKWAKWRPTPRETDFLLVIVVMLVLGIIGMKVLH